MRESGRRTWRQGRSWVVVGSLIGLVALTLLLGAETLKRRSWRAELSEAREAIRQNRLAWARDRLIRLADLWTNEGEVFLLLGECELARGRREEALKAWARVPEGSPFFARAAVLRATHLINSGHYGSSEELLLRALPTAPPGDRYDLERALSRVYRFQGRFDEVRLVLRASWRHSPDPAGVLKELWLLDHSPMPVLAWRGALDRADDADDRVWLGRANHAILTRDLAAASQWLQRCLEKRPEDLSVWRARLDLAMAQDDVAGLYEAAAHVPTDQGDQAEITAMRAWLARQRNDRDAERKELRLLIHARPGDTQAMERLAALAVEAADLQQAREFQRLKAQLDAAKDRYRKIVLDDSVLLAQAGELARLASRMGREFDARAWTLLEQAKSLASGADVVKFDGSIAALQPILQEARALSGAFVAPWESPPSIAPALREQLPELLAVDRTSRARSEAPEASAEPLPEFVDHAEEASLQFLFDNGQTSERLLPETMSGGVGLLDYDGDGWLDVYCVQGGTLGTAASRLGAATAQKDRLFRNQRDGTFRDVSDQCGLSALLQHRGYGLGVAVGDYDNDGRPDLFLTRLQTYVLLRNRGDGTFEDATGRAGLEAVRDNPTSAAFADLDNDGDLDLYVCHYMRWDPKNLQLCKNDKGEYFYCDPSKVEPAPDQVFRNDRGRFVDVTAEAGFVDPGGRGLGVVAADVNDDHLVDLFVSNDGTANYLFFNKGKFQFEEAGLLAGVAGNAGGGYQAGMGVACGDLDQDGKPDLLVTNFYGEGTSLYRNLGDGLFTDASTATGIGPLSRYLLGFGIALADVSNRGRLDVLITNGHVNDNRPYYLYAMPARLYQGRGDDGLKLVDISDQAGAPWQVQRVGRGLAAGDIDNDGRVDILILAQNENLAYLHNGTRSPGHFVTLGLEGKASNRDGVGAHITIVANGRRQSAARLGGGSYQSANDPRLHFGLGDATRVDRVEVRWPSGKLDQWSDLAVDTGYSLREGEREASRLPGFPERGGQR